MLSTIKVIHDISPVISSALAVFPVDTPFKCTIIKSFEQGDNFALSKIESTTHLGAHADAPGHYANGGVGIDKVDLSYYLGSCQVIEVNCRPGQRISLDDFNSEVIKCERVIFKTNSFNNYNEWSDDFMALSTDTAEFLALKKVRLVGIDTPSIDLAKDPHLEVHQIIARNGMAILEGLYLENIKEGSYFLSALPLKLLGADAAPVRAVLMEFNSKDTK